MKHGRQASRRAADLMMLVILLGLAVAVPATHGQEETEAETRLLLRLERYDEALHPTDEPGNAAILYRRAFDLLAAEGSDGALIHLENQVIRQSWEVGFTPGIFQSESARELVARTEEVLAMTRLAANLEYAEFGIDREQGYDLRIPHFSPMRHLVRLMDVHARVLRANGQLSDAAELTADQLRMSRHASSDQLLIGSFVGSACAFRTYESIEHALAHGELDADAARIMLKGLEADTHDPYRFAEAMAGEYDLLLAGMDDPAKALEEYQRLSSAGDDSLALEEYDDETLIEMVDQLGPAYELASTAFMENDLKQARAVFEELWVGSGSGAYGELGGVLVNALERAIAAKFIHDEKVAGFEETLRAIASGEDPDRHANAAIIYQTAFIHLRRIDEQDQEMLDMVRRVVAATGSCEALPDTVLEDVRTMIQESAPLVRMLGRAARSTHCTWELVEWSELLGRVIGEGEWVRPMRAAARLLLADAALALCREQGAGAGQRQRAAGSLADALAIILHLADGSHLFGEVVASATLHELADLLEATVENGILDRDGIERVEQRFARINGTDPFGWKRARDGMMRRSLHEAIMTFGIDEPSAASRLTRGLTNERLIMLGFLEVADDPGTHESMSRFSIDIDGPDPGDLFVIDDLLELDDDTLSQLNGPHQRLIELFASMDEARSIRVDAWHADSMASLARIEQTLREARSRKATPGEG